MSKREFYEWAKEYFSSENYPSYLSNREDYARGYRDGVFRVWDIVMEKLKEVNEHTPKGEVGSIPYPDMNTPVVPSNY